MSFSTLCANERPDAVYLDHNATTPLAADLVPRIQEWLAAWGNPSSIHWAGRKPKLLIREARRAFAEMVNCDPLEIVYTSGGSEANNFAVKGVFERFKHPHAFAKEFRNQYLFSAVEHPSLRRSAEYLIERGADVQFIPVRRDGTLDMTAFKAMLSERTALVSVMFANNETGNVFPIKELARLAHEKGALFHTDAVQALGKVPVDLKDLGVDLASFAGHKFYALKGIGVLYVRRGLQLENLIHGGAQERSRRGGTENILGICSLGAMALRGNEVTARAEALLAMRDEFEARVLAEIPGSSVTGVEGLRLPNTSSLVLAGVDGETLLMNLDMRGFAVSTGAACSSGSPEPSPVLLAMGLTHTEAQNSLRVGLGWSTTPEQMTRFFGALKDVVVRVRSFAPEFSLTEVVNATQ